MRARFSPVVYPVPKPCRRARDDHVGRRTGSCYRTDGTPTDRSLLPRPILPKRELTEGESAPRHDGGVDTPMGALRLRSCSAAILFTIGAGRVLILRNAIGGSWCIELMLNSGNLALVHVHPASTANLLA